MSNIGSVGSSNSSWMMQGMRPRPDAGKMAENLFSKLDASGQGFIQKSDLQTAFDSISSSRTTGSTTSVSFQEAMAYQQSSNSSGSTTTSESSTSAASTSSSMSEARVMVQIMKLMQAYDIGNGQNQTSGLISSLAVSA